MIMTGNHAEDSAAVRERLNPDASFDIIGRNIVIGERSASFYFVDGFIKDGVFEKVLQYLLDLQKEDVAKVSDMYGFAERYMPYVEADVELDVDKAVTAVLSGQTLLLCDGMIGGLLIDARTYPMRGVDQPEKDRVLRGARDGFVETLVMNTALIRRRIRDTALRVEYLQIGKSSKVDIALVYMDGVADKKMVDTVRKKLSSVKLRGISMTQEALSEALIDYSWFNPLPKIKFSERPDYTSACVLEGRIAVVMDNTPSAMILPTGFTDFLKEADDYYFPPITGSYIRFVRILLSFLTVFMTPLFLYFINNPDVLPDWLQFINIAYPVIMPPFFQFLILELLIDTLRLASTNTPSMMSTALGVIGGLLLSEFSIQSGWFAAEVILYMAFVSITSYAQPSFEMGYAQKFFRILTLILTQLFGLWGLGAGFIIFIVSMCITKTINGNSYFYPVIPFNAQDFKRMFLRRKLKNR